MRVCKNYVTIGLVLIPLNIRTWCYPKYNHSSRKIKKSYTNYNKLNIENKVIFEELDVLKKKSNCNKSTLLYAHEFLSNWAW